MKAMEHQWYDGKSFLGAICSIVFAWLGVVTLQDWAIVFSIGAALTTIVYNVVKTVKEIKNKKP